MQSSIKEEQGLKRKLEFIVPAEKVLDYFTKNYEKIQKTAKMPGFRQGRIPLSAIKQKYKDQAYKTVMDDLFNSFYPEALKKNQIHPAGPPTLLDLDLQENKDCKFLLELEVHPKVKVENYINLELKKKSNHINKEEVDSAIEKLRQSCAEFEDSSNKQALQKGDFFTVDIEGFLNSNNERKIHYSNLLLQAGENTIAPGFDNHLIGLHLNEKKEFNFSFPNNHPDPKIAGLNLNIRACLLAFKNKKIPELNNEFAQKFKVQNLEELKNRIEKDLKNNLEQKIKEEMENDIVQQLVEKNPVELPDILIKEQKEKLKDNARKRLEEYKMPKMEQEAFMKKNDSEFEKSAKESLHTSYLIGQLIQDLKIQTTPEDIKKSLQESFPTKKPEEMEKTLKKERYWDNFLFNLTRKKVISYLIDKAQIS